MADVYQVVENPGRTDAVNVGGTFNLLEAAREAQVQRLVYASTIWVYGNAPGPEPHDEDTPLVLPPHLYTATKLAGEMYCRSYDVLYGLPTTILRFGIPYGPRARPAAVVPAFIAKAQAGTPLTIAGDGSATRQFVYVEDLAEGVVAALAPEAAGRVYNLVGDELVSVREIADTVRELVADVPVEHGPDRPVDLVFGRTDSARAASELGWRARTSFADGVRRYVDWLTVTSGSPLARGRVEHRRQRRARLTPRGGGTVRVAVVEQHDGPGAEAPCGARGDRRRRRLRLPVAAPVRPEQRRPPLPREPEPGQAEHAVRRAVGEALAPGRLADHVRRACEVVADRTGRAAQEQEVAIAVDADLVPRGGDLGRQRRPPLDLLADQIEGRAHAGAVELPEHGRRPLAMRAVVERQCDAAAARQAQRDPEGRREGRGDGRCGGRAPCADGGSKKESATTHVPRLAPRPRRAPATRLTGSSGNATAVRPSSSAAATASRSAARRRRDAREPEAREGAVVRADVTAPPAVRDRRAAAHQRLEHGQPAGRMDERIGRGEPVRHLVRERLGPHTLVAREVLLERLPELLVVAAQADDLVDSLHGEHLAHRALDVADAPAAAGDEHDLGAGLQLEGAPRVGRRARLEELRRREAVHAMHLGVLARDPAHLVDRLRVRHEVQVGARRRPVAQPGQVGDDGADRHVQAPGLAQPPEHLRRVRVRRDDHVRPVGGDQAQQAPTAEPHEQPLREAAGHREAREDPEADVPQPEEAEEDDTRRVVRDGRDGAPHRRQAVLRLDHDVGPLGPELVGQPAGRGVVSLTDAGGEDQDAGGHRRSTLTPPDLDDTPEEEMKDTPRDRLTRR